MARVARVQFVGGGRGAFRNEDNDTHATPGHSAFSLNTHGSSTTGRPKSTGYSFIQITSVDQKRHKNTEQPG